MKWHIRAFILTAPLLTAAAGCQSPAAPESAFERQSIDETADAPPLKLRDQYTAQAHLHRFQLVTGGNASASTITVKRERATEHQAEWRDVEQGGRVDYWRVEDGLALLTAVLDPDENTLSQFDPPLVVGYAELSPGEQREATASIRVVYADRPDRLRDRGAATRTIEHLGWTQVQTDRGTETLLHIRTTFRAELQRAEAERTADLFIEPGTGIVARDERERIRILGLFGPRSSRSLLRVRETESESEDRP
ncbi:MAG: hypothetical protein EA377_07040 [Phycisphaerales bacterium]|nr:MAG: hypothetical protein EA377_07040 [Phycisphaerales bacterium]